MTQWKFTDNQYILTDSDLEGKKFASRRPNFIILNAVYSFFNYTKKKVCKKPGILLWQVIKQIMKQWNFF